MFSHVMIGANDIPASKVFYDATLATMGHKPGMADESRCVYMTDNGMFVLTKPINGEAACHGNGSTIGFAADSAATVDAWHAAGVANGGTSCEDLPGERNSPMGKLYLAYLRDPAGNKICALHRLG